MIDVNKLNVYKFVVDKIGKEDRETFLPSPYGGTAIREWKCGCVLARRVELDLASNKYSMKDEYYPCSRHKHIYNEIQRKLSGHA